MHHARRGRDVYRGRCSIGLECRPFLCTALRRVVVSVASSDKKHGLPKAAFEKVFVFLHLSSALAAMAFHGISQWAVACVILQQTLYEKKTTLRLCYKLFPRTQSEGFHRTGIRVGVPTACGCCAERPVHRQACKSGHSRTV